MNQSQYHVVMPGYVGDFQATTAKEAKQMLIAKIQANRREQPPLTRCQRRYLLNRATAWKVGP